MVGHITLFCLGQPLALEPVGDVLGHRVPGEQRVLLEDDRAFPARLADGLAAAQELAARRRPEPREQVQQRRLAAAARPHDREELVVLHLKADTVEREERLTLDRDVHLAHVVDDDLSHRYRRYQGMATAAIWRIRKSRIRPRMPIRTMPSRM